MHSEVVKPAKDKPRGGHQKGDISKKTLEERAKIIELCRAGKTMREIQDIIGLSQTSTYRHIKKLVQSGQLAEHEVPYHKTEEGKWYKVIERTAQGLPFYERQQIVPTARKMYYRLIELRVLTKSAK
jgi:DNA-binding MarR family transcriptional regulator